MPRHDLLCSGRILIVDDEPDHVALLESLLRSDGYESVRGITDPRTVTAACDEFDPHLILLDLSMPHVDGFQVLELVHERAAGFGLAVIVVTGHTDRDTCLRALAAGACDVIGKPFDSMEVLTRVANVLGARLLHQAVRESNELLAQRVAEATRDLQEARLEVVHRLGRAAEYRDNETGLHTIRIGRSCEMVAKAVGMTDEECTMVLHAAPMHDVGKIGIRDAILLKPARLDPDEWEVMKTHTHIGAEILSGGRTELLRTAEAIALTHHERWDGAGYPDALPGDAIPVAGRICALCDVFDALTSVRPYKPAWPVEEAIAYVRSASGTQFDPELTEGFVRSLPEIMFMRDQYREPDQPPSVSATLDGGTM